MSVYGNEPLEDQDNQRTTKLPQPVLSLTKYGKVALALFFRLAAGEVKKAFDMLAITPGKMRRGVCRHGDSLRGFTDYNIKLFRSDDKKWTLYAEWVDLDGERHRVVFPHEVVAGVLQRANSIIAQGRSERAKNAALTRKQKGIIPFQKKSPQEQG